MLLCLTPALAAFNVAANAKFAPIAEGYIEVRDRAATSFMQYGVDGRGITRLHPREGHADVLLRVARERGVYELPRVSHFETFPDAQPSTRIITYVDEFVATERAVTIGGWAMIPGVKSERGQVHVLLRSATSDLALTTVTLQRPDVAKAYKQPGWRLSGFRAVIRTRRLPKEDFEVGVLIEHDGGVEYMMTGHKVLAAAGTPTAVGRPPNP